MNLELQDIFFMFPADTRLTIIDRKNGETMSDTIISETDYDFGYERISTIKAVAANHIIVTIF